MLTKFATELISLIVPPTCLGCGKALIKGDQQICQPCSQKFVWLQPPLCQRCGLPAPCNPCPAANSAFDQAFAPLAYDGTARLVVKALKFKRATNAAKLIAAQISTSAPAQLFIDGELVPMPLHPARFRKRGFNQSLLIAKNLSRLTNTKLRNCLVRRGSLTRQLGSGRSTRLGQKTDIDIAITPNCPSPRKAILIDDVHTTGASLDAGAKALRKAGATEVIALTYARVLTT